MHLPLLPPLLKALLEEQRRLEQERVLWLEERERVRSLLGHQLRRERLPWQPRLVGERVRKIVRALGAVRGRSQ